MFFFLTCFPRIQKFKKQNQNLTKNDFRDEGVEKFKNMKNANTCQNNAKMENMAKTVRENQKLMF